MDDHKQLRLFAEPDVRAILEEYRLKDEDLQKTLFTAEQTGQKFVHPETGHFLAAVRQNTVTVWVEYSARDQGYEIFKAYQHRVKISAWDLKTGRARSITENKPK